MPRVCVVKSGVLLQGVGTGWNSQNNLCLPVVRSTKMTAFICSGSVATSTVVIQSPRSATVALMSERAVFSCSIAFASLSKAVRALAPGASCVPVVILISSFQNPLGFLSVLTSIRPTALEINPARPQAINGYELVSMKNFWVRDDFSTGKSYTRFTKDIIPFCVLSAA